MTDEEALQNLLTLLVTFKVIDYWAISILNSQNKVKLCAVVIKDKAYGDIDKVAWDYIRRK